MLTSFLSSSGGLTLMSLRSLLSSAPCVGGSGLSPSISATAPGMREGCRESWDERNDACFVFWCTCLVNHSSDYALRTEWHALFLSWPFLLHRDGSAHLENSTRKEKKEKRMKTRGTERDSERNRQPFFIDTTSNVQHLSLTFLLLVL